ncbi:Aste57867_21737 [Aphanomyces stellatus]|uniref:Aste57867_21737 protein n=1 Tax=Aphanomyces stellatus TaxID=120398 RepID=A0A485LJN0_9STRA|nr:hypothetical protein As57867_021668 [Aphanomyces stellatus]VFT98406.1 Aste57867_21737 [Aphanomyces stellatus]
MHIILPLHAVYFGRTDVLDSVVSFDVALVCDMAGLMDVAAASGSLSMVQYLHVRGCTAGISVSSLMLAATAHLDIVCYLANTMLNVDDADAAANAFRQVLHMASMRGDVRVVQYAMRHCTPRQRSQAMHSAAQQGHVDVVELLLGHSLDAYITSTMSAACHMGQVAVVRLLLAEMRRRAWSYRYQPVMLGCLRGAVRGGHVATARLILEREGALPVVVFAKDVEELAATGRLAMLQLVHEDTHLGENVASSVERRACRGRPSQSTTSCRLDARPPRATFDQAHTGTGERRNDRRCNRSAVAIGVARMPGCVGRGLMVDREPNF